MKYAVSSEEMKIIDDYTVRVSHIPELELMERAAAEVAATVMKRVNKEDDRILAVCGPGNNGGDGIAAGRLLYLQGYHVAILFIGDEERATASAREQLNRVRILGVPIENRNRLSEYNIIIDAVFGVGLSRDVTGEYEALIQEINQSRHMVFSVDIPSGISADNGKVMGTAVRADYTITFGYMKKGLLLYPGTEYAGEVAVADIGFSEDALSHVKPDTFYYTPEDVRLNLPPRKRYSHKGTYGRILVIAGCKGMSGAAYLSAKAAYRTGAGLVKIFTSEANRIILQTSLPEALFSGYDEVRGDVEEICRAAQRELDWATTVIIGPGIGRSELAKRLLETVMQHVKVPLIVDADAINLLAEKLDISAGLSVNDRLSQLSRLLADHTILTPHLMELSRLTGIPVAAVKDNLIDTAGLCSYNSKLIYVIKDARTIVAERNRYYINVSGNNGMATGGSGDVLTGILGALIAQGMDSFAAACLGVYIHGLAGDEAAREKGFYSMMAGDIVDSIEKII